MAAPKHVKHNLGPRQPLVGRNRELAEVHAFLTADCPRPASLRIEGPRGIGTSALALEAAWGLIQTGATHHFDRVLWVDPLPTTVSGGPWTHTALHYLRHVAATMRGSTIYSGMTAVQANTLGLEECVDLIYRHLESTDGSVLILDGLVPLLEGTHLGNFLRFLPDPSRAIITTHGGLLLGRALRLPLLADDAIAQIVAGECSQHGISLDVEQMDAVCQHVRGFVPLARDIVERMGHQGVPAVMAQLPTLWQAFAATVFSRAAAQLQAERPGAYELLCAMSRSPSIAQGMGYAELAAASGTTVGEARTNVEHLQVWALATRVSRTDRFTVSSAVRAYFGGERFQPTGTPLDNDS